MYRNTGAWLLIMGMLIGVVRMQKWTGTYAWDDQCKSDYCCCYAGTLTVVQSDSNLVFSSGTRGCSSSRSSSTVSYPQGYSFSTMGSRGARIDYQLSSDSNTITVRNSVYNYCGGSAKRISAGVPVYPSFISCAIILFTKWILF